MQLLENFGFEPVLFIGQILNFIIIYFILKKFMYGPLMKKIDERNHKIAKGLRDAEESSRKLTEAALREEDILKRAQEQAKQLIAETKIQQDTMVQEAEEKTRQRVETMIKEARQQISFETAQAEKRLSAQVAQLAVVFLQKTVQDLFGEKEQELIMKNAMKKLKEKRVD